MAAATPLDPESVRQLYNLADINRLLHEANARERSIDAELERILSLRSQIEQDAIGLEEATKEVSGSPCQLAAASRPPVRQPARATQGAR